MTRSTMRRRLTRTVGVLLVTVTSAVATVSTGAAQTQSALPDGQYEGIVSMGGGFTADASAFGDATGFMVARSAVSGPAGLLVDGGSIGGSWGMSGSGSVEGWFGIPGGGMGVNVDTAYDGSGSFAGAPGAIRMVGSVNTSGSATFGFATADSSDTQSIDEPLTGVWVDCGRLYARFDRAIAAEIESLPGFEEQLVGVLYLRDGGMNDELSAEAAALAAEAGTLAAAADQLPGILMIRIPEGLLTGDSAVGQVMADIGRSSTDTGTGLIRPEAARQMAEDALESQVAPLVEEAARVSPRWILERAVELLEQIEQLEAALAGDCPPDEQFRNLLSDAAATIVDAMLDLIDKNQLDPDLLPLIVRLAAGTGLTAAPGPNVSTDDGLIGPRVAEALAKHALGGDSGDSSSGDSSGGESTDAGESVSDGPADSGVISESTASDLAAIVVQTAAGE